MKICIACQEEIRGYGLKFCSLSCSSKFNAKRGPRTNKVKECPECGQDFYYKDSRKKFCSHSCAAKYNNQMRVGSLSPVKCRRCQNPCGTGRKYCSRYCREQYPIDEWLAGRLSAQNSYQIAEWARRYVFARADYRCEAIDSRSGSRCEENRFKSSGKTVLTVDHIDGNWQNSWPDNLRALCPTCHALTENYGALNMGNGRTWKKKYSQYRPKVDVSDGTVVP